VNSFRDTKAKKYVSWRISVFERDRYECQKCGSKNNLHAHHIVEWDHDVSLRYELDNGLTVCSSCHFKIHREGKLPWNTGKKMLPTMGSLVTRTEGQVRGNIVLAKFRR